MKILILGGTGWLGGLLASLAADAGHDVTSLSRNAPEVSHPGITYALANRDEDAALAPFGAEAWDAVVDVSSQPGHVRRAARALGAGGRGHGTQYVYVSSCSVYPDNATPGTDESAPTEEPLEADSWADMELYGAAKVACENAVLDAFGPGRATIIRPGLIGGPGDTSNRSTYWPWRFAHPSTPDRGVLVPGVPDLITATLDVRDLAAWILRLMDSGTTGVFNALGEPIALADHIAAAKAAAGYSGPVVTVPQEWLFTHGVNPWAGPQSLPLWIPMPDYAGFNTRSTARARAAGLTWRPLAETVRDAGEWWTGHVQADGSSVVVKSGLTDAEEAELLKTATATPEGACE